jgi:adenylate cyclase class 2
VAGGLEIEVKLRVDDLAQSRNGLVATKALLEEMGASLTYPREFEDNLAFDFPDGSIVRVGSLLRVRILARGTLLTFKGPVTSLADLARKSDTAETARTPAAGPSFKARHETELTIPFDETEALLAIIRGLGMETVFRYQKYRTSYDWKGLHVLLDETPIGIYLELEGDRAMIEAGAKRLGYQSEDFITRSYRDLYLEQLDHGGEGLDGSCSREAMLFA